MKCDCNVCRAPMQWKMRNVCLANRAKNGCRLEMPFVGINYTIHWRTIIESVQFSADGDVDSKKVKWFNILNKLMSEFVIRVNNCVTFLIIKFKTIWRAQQCILIAPRVEVFRIKQLELFDYKKYLQQSANIFFK